MRAAAWQITWTAFVLCAPRLAAAQQEEVKAVPLSVSLEYDAPAQCVGSREFRATVRKRLGRDPFVDGPGNRVLVLVTRLGGVLSGEISWRDGKGSSTGRQSFPSTTDQCAQLIDAMAFALAVQIQLLETEVAESAKSTSRESSSSEAKAQKQVAPSPASSPGREQPSVASSRPAQPRRPMAWFLGAGGGLAFGMSSHVLPEGRLFAGLRWTAVAIELGLEASTPAVVRRADGAGFSQWYLVSSAAGCALFAPWSACALLKVGTVQVSGRDIDVPNSAGAPLAQAGLRLALSQRLTSRLFVSLRGEGLVNLTRWSVTLDQLPVSSAPRFAYVLGPDFGILFQ